MKRRDLLKFFLLIFVLFKVLRIQVKVCYFTVSFLLTVTMTVYLTKSDLSTSQTMNVDVKYDQCYIKNNHHTIDNHQTNEIMTMLIDSNCDSKIYNSLDYQIPSSAKYQSVVRIKPNSKCSLFYVILILIMIGIVILLLIAIAVAILYFLYPCQIKVCKKNELCQPNKDGLATCICKTCSSVSTQLHCGSDHFTYQSVCDIERKSCLFNISIYVLHAGPCVNQTNEPAFNPCDNKLCPYYAICVQSPTNANSSSCECPQCNDQIYDPMCGSDDITYHNFCALKKYSCAQQLLIFAKYSGPCQSCESLQCNNYAICDVNYETGRPECLCPKVCVHDLAPVCGSNGETYQNECELRMDSCLLQKEIQIDHKGPCDQCEKIICKTGSYCSKGKCICNQNCSNHIFEPICASDGNTYKNLCELQKENCLYNRSLVSIYFGSCHDKTTNFSLDVEIEPMDVEYDLRANLLKEQKLSCDNFDCKFGGQCAYNKYAEAYCECNFECERTRLYPNQRKFFLLSLLPEKVCGSNGIIYASECELKSEACINQLDIQMVKFNMCTNQSQPLITDKSIDDTAKTKNKCNESKHGCCLDGVFEALGPNYLGCPERCFCNKKGSLESTCDPITRQCKCKPGISGLRCDRCKPGYWGLHKIQGSEGCMPCDCNEYGSVRSDCEQATGKCVCIPSVNGIKCDQCPSGTNLGPNGCTHGSISLPRNGSCNDIICLHQAICVQNGNTAQCICDIDCSKSLGHNSQIICGSDSNTYLSECQLTKASCLYQSRLFIKHNGPC